MLFLASFVQFVMVNPAFAEPVELKNPPVLRWVTQLPKTAALNSEFARPLIHKKYIYVGSSQQAALLIYEKSTGALIKTIDVSAPIQGHPQIVNNMLYVADTAGTIYRFNLEGKKIWSRAGEAPILSGMTIHDDRIFIQNVDDVLLTLNLENGDLLWRYEHKTDISRRRDMTLYGAPAPLLNKEHIYGGFSDGAIVQLKETDGSIENVRWIGEGRYPDIIATPSIDEDRLIISGAEEPLTAYAQSLQEEFWRVKSGSNHAVVSLDDSTFLHSGTDGVLRAYEKRTGAEMWSWDSEIQAALSEPVVTDLGVLIASSGGTVYCVNPETQEIDWKYQPDYHISGLQHSPVINGNDIVWLTNAGMLYAFRTTAKQKKSCPGIFCNWMDINHE